MTKNQLTLGVMMTLAGLGLMPSIATTMTTTITTAAYAVSHDGGAPSQNNCEANPNCAEIRNPAGWCAVFQAENLGPGHGFGGMTTPELTPGSVGCGRLASGG